jgi:hypothetical protein
MHKDLWAKKKFKVTGGRNTEVTCEFLSGDYSEPTCSKPAKAGETGLLEILRIEPKQTGLPTFVGRWDQRANSIDIDLLGDPSEARMFAMQKPGFRGHKTRTTSERPRVRALDIETPRTGPVFRGKVSDFSRNGSEGSRALSYRF